MKSIAIRFFKEGKIQEDKVFQSHIKRADQAINSIFRQMLEYKNTKKYTGHLIVRY